MRAALIAFAALSLAAPALADSVPQPQQVATTAQPLPQASPENKIVCHSQIHEGSVTPIKLCGSQQAWERTRLETMKTLNEIEVRSYTNTRRR
ncbi:MAG TPA: hypothetical protein VHE09_01025 [Rhizomicrobium sp.]|jgi:hypothetical protein|nr:hypothetical protein [Rhizomicrobium sp.]